MHQESSLVRFSAGWKPAEQTRLRDRSPLLFPMRVFGKTAVVFNTTRSNKRLRVQAKIDLKASLRSLKTDYVVIWPDVAMAIS